MQIVISKDAEAIFQEVLDIALKSEGMNAIHLVNTILKHTVISDEINITQKEEEKEPDSEQEKKN